jgi:hypothetical protein
MSSGDESPSVIQIERFAHTQFYIAFARYMEGVGLRASFRYELQQSQQIEWQNLCLKFRASAALVPGGEARLLAAAVNLFEEMAQHAHQRAGQRGQEQE